MLPGVGGAELLTILVVALVVVGPKDLPRLMRLVAQAVGKAQGLANEFRSGFEALARQSELEELRHEIHSLRATPLSTAASAAKPVERDADEPAPSGASGEASGEAGDEADDERSEQDAAAAEASEAGAEGREPDAGQADAEPTDSEGPEGADSAMPAEAPPRAPPARPPLIEVDAGMWH